MLIFAANDLSLTTMAPRLFLSMAVVIGVMWLAARVMKNRQFTNGGFVRKSASQKAATTVEVVAKQGLSKGATITVVRVGGKELVLGVTDSTISLLATNSSLGEAANSSLGEAEAAAATLSLGTPNANGETADEGRMQSEVQGTGTPRNATPVVVSSSTRKGLLEQVREMTVRH